MSLQAVEARVEMRAGKDDIFLLVCETDSAFLLRFVCDCVRIDLNILII